MDKPNVVIIIPTYNEALVIEQTLRAVIKAVQSDTEHQISVLVFDSNSTDDTALIVQELSKKLPIYFHSEAKKTGLGSAYRQAMNYAMDTMKADIVFEFDADGSHKPEYILPMLTQLKTNDVVVGSRYVSGGSMPNDWPLLRKCFSRGGSLFCQIFLTRHLKDMTSGFRATRAKFLKPALAQAFLSNQYSYKIELYWRLYKAGAQVKEYPIAFVDREKGHSKLPRGALKDAMRVVLSLRIQSLFKSKKCKQ